jgi:hypothetical protein
MTRSPVTGTHRDPAVGGAAEAARLDTARRGAATRRTAEQFATELAYQSEMLHVQNGDGASVGEIGIVEALAVAEDASDAVGTPRHEDGIVLVPLPVPEDASEAGVAPRCEFGAIETLVEAESASEEGCPAHLTCPLTLELFVDPVIVFVSGLTYERAALLAIIEHAGSDAREPQTREPLSITGIVSNRAVREAADLVRQSLRPW